MENNELLKMTINGLYGKGCKNAIFLTDEHLELMDTLCRIIIENKINEKSIKPFIHGVVYIYTSVLVEPTADQIKRDISDGTLTVNIVNNENVLIYMKENGDYYAYNLCHDVPDGGEELEKGMGWL